MFGHDFYKLSGAGVGLACSILECPGSSRLTILPKDDPVHDLGLCGQFGPEGMPAGCSLLLAGLKTYVGELLVGSFNHCAKRGSPFQLFFRVCGVCCPQLLCFGGVSVHMGLWLGLCGVSPLTNIFELYDVLVEAIVLLASCSGHVVFGEGNLVGTVLQHDLLCIGDV